MKLDNSYLKYIKGKTNPIVLIKSSGLSGTLAAIYRVFYLKNNYCLYDNDRILYLTKDKDLSERARLTYNKLKGESELDYITLFSFIEERIEFKSIDDITESCFKEHLLKNPSIKIIDDRKREEIIRESLDAVKKEYISLKLFNSGYVKFFNDEIKWMKCFDYTDIETYQNCLRTGRGYKKGEGPGSIRKNSRSREGIFKLFSLYEDRLRESNLIDLEDRDRLALKEAKTSKYYTHIIVDEARLYTKKQLEIIKALKSSRTYGEMTYVYKPDNEALIEAFLTKPNRISELYSFTKIKNFNFKRPIDSELLLMFENNIEVAAIDEMETKDEEMDTSIEKFEFISLKNGSEFKFIRDITRKDSIVLLDGEVEEEVTSDEMKEIPVFSNIAAGEPILMNPDVEDTFYLPEYWVKGMDNHFILRVKGDSMINANINNGDFVVVKSTQSAQNRDIVAVDIDGSATLKRLIIKGRTAILMPENERYSPIVITEDGAHILGVAVGLIKENL